MTVSCRKSNNRERTRAARGRIPLTGAILLLALAVAACELKSLPTAPSELTSGLTIYLDANYLGESALLTHSIDDLGDFKGPCEHTESIGTTTTTTFDWEDCVSAVRIAQGWRATLYRDREFKGESVEVAADVANLQLVAGGCNHDGMNDCVSSIKVVPPAMADAGASTLERRRRGPTPWRNGVVPAIVLIHGRINLAARHP